jgi:hypothetical protein
VIGFDVIEVAGAVLLGYADEQRMLRRLAKKYGLPTTREAAEAALENGTANEALRCAAARLSS